MRRENNNWMKVMIVITMAAAEARAEDRRATKGDRITVSIAERKLVLWNGQQVLRVYDVAVGKPSTPTPVGEFRIVNRVIHPTYYGHNVVVAPGKDNPLGTRWMGLSAVGYGIHGTNAPTSIGQAASHGCIRMRQTDLEELFELVGIGTTVELVGQAPALLAQMLTPQVAAVR